MVTTEKIYKIWSWCTAAYIRHGIKLQFPKDTDPKKTYQWRYLSKISEKIDEWGFGDDLARKFIDITADYAASRRLHAKGLAVFHQNNLLELCYRKLKAQLTMEDANRDSVASCRSWFIENTGDDPVSALLYKTTIGGYPNIVRWYQSGKLSEQYLALSRSCAAAMAGLPAQDRALLPNPARLFIVRSSLLNNPASKVKLQLLMGSDWRK